MTSFLSCDWGTSTFRLRLVEEHGTEWSVVNEIKSDRGVRSFQESSHASTPEAFAAHLVEVMTAMNAPAVPVVISGMASSSIGWKELPYAGVPFAVGDPMALKHDCLHIDYRGGKLPVHLLSGIRTSTDVMRGEEAEIIGILALPDLRPPATDRCLIILPGTHSKHVRIENGRVVDFTTFMTGEVFELLARQSILRATADWDSLLETNAAQDSAFDHGVRAARDHGLASNLFRVRTRGVLDGYSSSLNIRYLLGLMIGDELNNLPVQDSSVTIVLASGPAFLRNYRQALDVFEVSDSQLVCLTAEQLANATVRAHASWLQHFALR